jgi:hypothetical protein
MSARIIQVTLLLMLNNAFILLAVADIDLLKFALLGGWTLIGLAGVYLAMAINRSDFNDRYRDQERRYK